MQRSHASHVVSKIAMGFALAAAIETTNEVEK
jgi:hypothetical protein